MSTMASGAGASKAATGLFASKDGQWHEVPLGGGGGASALDDLTDVTASANTPAGKMLGTTAQGVWGPVDPPASGASALDDLTDVTAPTDTPAGKVLGTTAQGVWGPVNPPAAGASALNDLTDVDTTTVAPGRGDVMSYNKSGLWMPQVPVPITFWAYADPQDTEMTEFSFLGLPKPPPVAPPVFISETAGSTSISTGAYNAGDLLLVHSFSFDSDRQVTAVTATGLTFTRITAAATASFHRAYYAIAPAAGSSTLALTWSTTGGANTARCYVIRNVDPVSPFWSAAICQQQASGASLVVPSASANPNTLSLTMGYVRSTTPIVLNSGGVSVASGTTSYLSYRLAWDYVTGYEAAATDMTVTSTLSNYIRHYIRPKDA